MAQTSGNTHHLIVGTFRHPYLYTLEFSRPDSSTPRQRNALKILSKLTATGGHSWLHLDPLRGVLYCTGWTQPPSLAAYKIEDTRNPSSPLRLRLLNQAYPKYLSGYVTVDQAALYSASGPQGDVFALDPSTGAFASQKGNADTQAETEAAGPIQSFSFLSQAEQEAIDRGENVGGIMDFGGLRHGGHSADLSPDGKRLYVADMQRPQRNLDLPTKPSRSDPMMVQGMFGLVKLEAGRTGLCMWYKNTRQGSTFSQKGRIANCTGQTVSPTYSLLSITADRNYCITKSACAEVRTSPKGDVLFASTRGLEPSEKGYIIAVELDPATGKLPSDSTLLVNPTSGIEEYVPLHRWQTPTSGGWANAINVCPTLGAGGEVYISLTDSEQGWVWMLQWTLADGFEVVGSVNLNEYGEEGNQEIVPKKGDGIGASVTVWYD
ncbi:hypothetical protein QFC19_000064 [Naganishia cerealis]|uniref:Uncharacterized protein n=1 Tax=Naganishia cerealis TaxID=610337 RepID=A0ACC2WR39_9TREE|nr:hypothetical protein QFC19_000064 [Naganishia cerealis]